MTALWRVARAAIRRRVVQTIVIGVVVGVSTATIVLALGLLTAAAAPFDRAHARQNGAHLVAAFDNTVVSDGEVRGTAGQPGVAVAAGPFGQVSLDAAQAVADTGGPGGRLFLGVLTIVGRADPGGRVDRLDLWRGRWPSGPGEIVLNRPRRLPDFGLGTRIESPGRPALTVVGFAYSVSASADAWVTPDQVIGLRPTAAQMLYRFTGAATAERIGSNLAAVTAGLPSEAVLGTRSYLTVKQQLDSEVGVYVPFLVVFGILGATVAVLIVANVVGGAVVAGFGHIGVLKALGFTPNQVMAVYLVMVSVPAVVGCVLGTVAGHLLARPLLAGALEVFGSGEIGIHAWVDVVALLGMPAVVVLAALVSALRARRLPATEAIRSAGAPRVRRAPLVQRWLGASRLPRPVSLGLGVPFARPARSALTLAGVVLGVLTVTLAIGVTMSVNVYVDATRPFDPDRIEVIAGPAPMGGADGPAGPPAPGGTAGQEALLRSLPGTVHVAAITQHEVNVIGGQSAGVLFHRGAGAELGPRVLTGRWPDGPGELAAPSRFLNQRGLALGDTITAELNGHGARMRIVGVVLANDPDTVFADWDSLSAFALDARADSYQVQLAPGTDQQAFRDAVRAGDPELTVLPPRESSSDQAVVLIGSATLLTLVLGTVAALGVFNTVVLNARERRRDLGMLRSIGMTPRQVTVMLVTSMGAIGVLGGLVGVPLGILAHRVVATLMMRTARSDVFDFVLDVYRVPVLAATAAAGIVIAVLGALVPARGAARSPIAAVLRNE